MFAKDGKFVLLDTSGYAVLKVEFACVACHHGRDTEWMYGNAGRIHKE